MSLCQLATFLFAVELCAGKPELVGLALVGLLMVDWFLSQLETKCLHPQCDQFRVRDLSPCPAINKLEIV